MIDISIKKKDFSVLVENYRFKKTYFNDKFTIFYIGNFRTPISKIEKIIFNFKEKNFEEKNVEKIFREIDGICCLLIINKDFIKICPSIYHPYLKVFKTKDFISITDKEFIYKKKLSQKKSFLKLFTHHSYFFQSGISSDVFDFICPGSLLSINKSDSDKLRFSWYLNFDEFCSNDNHDEIAKDLAENFVNVFDNLDSNREYLLALSGGIDSALLLAAANQKRINIKPFHLTRAVYSDELKNAKSVSEYFGKKLMLIYSYDKKFSTLSRNDNIENIINSNYSLSKTDSVFFPLNNADSFINLKFSGEHIFNGDEFPTLLTIDHFMSYPDSNKNKIMGYQINSDKRYPYSLKFLEKLKEKENLNDFSNLKNNFPNIDPYYYPIISTFYEQSPKMLLEFTKSGFDYSGYKDNAIKLNNNEQTNNIQKLKKLNTNLIINKILLSDFFYKNLKVPNNRIAQILIKLLKFLGGAGKSIHQSSRLNFTNNVNESVGLNSSIVLKELSTVIDERLVDYSKWHIFKAFEILSGTKFESLYKKENNKSLNYLIPRINLRLNSIIKKTYEWDDRYALINNKSFNEFLDKNKIEEKFNDFKASHELGEYIYNFPSKVERNNLIETNNNFWKLNNIINIMSHLD